MSSAGGSADISGISSASNTRQCGPSWRSIFWSTAAARSRLTTLSAGRFRPPLLHNDADWALSHDLGAGLLEDIAELNLELGQESLELGRLEDFAVEIAFREKLLPRRSAADLQEQILVIAHGVARHARRADDAAHLRHLRDVEACFLQRRYVREARQPPFADLRDGAELAGAHLLAGLARIDDHHVDVAAEQRGDTLAPGRERDERPARAGHLHQQLPHDVLARGDRAARHFQRARLLLRELDEIVHR